MRVGRRRGGLGALAVALATSLGIAAPAAADPFVRARGNELVLNDQPFRFVGANLSIMHYSDRRARAEEVLAAAAADGVRVGRIWALGEGAADAGPWLREHFLFRAGPDGWLDAPLDQLDGVLAAARKVGIRLVITLSNNWADFGGVPQYLQWAGLWDEKAYGAQDRFYSDARCKAAFKAHVARLLERRNEITGVAYKDDPTILAWELMNESAVVSDAGALARRRWIAEMARFIRARDPNHLVVSGVSHYRTRRQRQEWLAICRLPEIDVCDAHIYPEELLGNRNPGAALEAMIDDFVQNARFVAGKPFFMGELGIAGGSWEGESRGHWLRRIFERLAFDGASGGLVWIYQPWTGQERPHAIFVGDARGEEDRQAMGAAARVFARELPNNPALGPKRGMSKLLPLQTEYYGKNAAIAPAVGAPGGLSATWDPKAYSRAFWEISGFYAGGAVEHAWGGDSGWFEYTYEVTAPAPRPPKRLTLRARASSEFPGALSPPGGTSFVRVTLDGRPLGQAVVARDDAKGAWNTLRSSTPALARTASAPGRHVLRFEVPEGLRARGLCLYGAATGKEPVEGETGPIELRME